MESSACPGITSSPSQSTPNVKRGGKKGKVGVITKTITTEWRREETDRTGFPLIRRLPLIAGIIFAFVAGVLDAEEGRDNGAGFPTVYCASW